MKKIIFILGLIFSIQLNAQCDTIKRYNEKIFSEYDLENYKYGENRRYNGELQELTVDVYTPKGDTIKDRPLIVFCFGGAFVSGNRKSPEILVLAEAFARRGYVCASIDYRLDEQTNMLSGNEAQAVIRGVQDAKAAIKFLKSMHDSIGFDTSRIVIGGTSAGGVIALTIGYSSYNEFPIVIRSIIDTMGGYEGTTNTLKHNSDVVGVFNLSGAILDTHHIQANDLPVYLNHSVGDQVVPFYSGKLLNGATQTSMDGSGSILQRIQNEGGTVSIDSFNDSNHPSFVSSNPITGLTRVQNLETALTTFFCETTYKSVSIPNDTSGTGDTTSTSLIFNHNQQHIKLFINQNQELIVQGKVFQVLSRFLI